MNNIARSLYLHMRDIIMERGGLQPKGVFNYSAFKRKSIKIPQKPVSLPNLSGELRPVIQQYMEIYGLGKKCLLVSENFSVKKVLETVFMDVSFEVSDYYTELMEKQEGDVDHIWDVCCQPPTNLFNKTFNSIVSQSLLEHTIAPTTALINFVKMLSSNGHLFLSTHTPSFHYHAYPRDYVRFHHDYFFDLPAYIKKVSDMDIRLLELHSTKGVICVCFQKQ